MIALIMRHWCGDLGGDLGPLRPEGLVTARHWLKPLLLAGLRKGLSSPASRRRPRQKESHVLSASLCGRLMMPSTARLRAEPRLDVLAIHELSALVSLTCFQRCICALSFLSIAACALRAKSALEIGWFFQCAIARRSGALAATAARNELIAFLSGRLRSVNAAASNLARAAARRSASATHVLRHVLVARCTMASSAVRISARRSMCASQLLRPLFRPWFMNRAMARRAA